MVEIRGLEQILELPQNLQVVVNSAFRRLMRDAQLKAKENTARGRPGLIARRGNLYNSIKLGPYRQWSPGGVGSQKIYSDSRYAGVHEYGAIITAKRSPYLRFRIWQAIDTTNPTGPWVAVRSVRIPKRPFAQPAVDDVVRDWPIYINEALDDLRGQL